ncbi:MAG TPA: hypothetical protein VIY51_29325 [Xanthobacteraceae bacterium]
MLLRTATALVLMAGAVAPALANDTSAELATGGLLFVHNDNVEEGFPTPWQKPLFISVLW